MQTVKKIIFSVLIAAAFLSACKRNTLKVDISGIDEEVEIVRFDEKLFNLPLKDTLKELRQLRGQYPGFFDLFTWKVIGIGGIEDEYFPELMTNFIKDTMIINARSLVKKEFAEFSNIENDLIEAFKYYKYHFPEKELPKIFTMISGFNQSVVTAENIIGISLDKYLGSDCSYYRMLTTVPSYKLPNMNSRKMISDVIYAWGITEFEEPEEATTVLANIIYQGKLMYFTDALLPEMHDTLKIGYTGKQLSWCIDNEPQMWNYLVEHKMLYSNNRMDILRYINDGPYTTGFPVESPPRTGIWIGWQIVREYMRKHKEITLQELMKNNDHQQILNDSRYYPE
jgi:gliding motility-associated lipoprotein GldB